MIYGQMARMEEAKAELDKLLALVPEFPTKARDSLPWMGSGAYLDHVIDGLVRPVSTSLTSRLLATKRRASKSLVRVVEISF